MTPIPAPQGQPSPADEQRRQAGDQPRVIIAPELAASLTDLLPPEHSLIPNKKLDSYVVTLPVASIKVGNRYRQELGDIPALAQSIQELGLLQPIGVDKGHGLIFGERRLRAHQHLGLETIKARIIEVDTLLAEKAENEIRKDFTASERVAIAKAIEEALGNRQGQRTDKVTGELPQFFGEVKGKETAQIAAKAAGFGNVETYRQAKTVIKEAIPELVNAVDRGEIAISTAAKLAKAITDAQKEAVAKPKDAPRLAKAAPPSFPVHGDDAVISEGEPAIPGWKIEMQAKEAGNKARKIAIALNLLKGYENHLPPKAKAPLVRNLHAALNRLGEEPKANLLLARYAFIASNLLLESLEGKECPPEDRDRMIRAAKTALGHLKQLAPALQDYAESAKGKEAAAND